MTRMFRHDVLTAAEQAAERCAAERARRGKATSGEEKAAYVDSYLDARVEAMAERAENSNG